MAANGIPSASLVSDSRIIPPFGFSLLNPAFAFNESGTGVLGFTITSSTLFPSTGFIQFTATAPTGFLKVSGPGVTADDGFTGCGGVGRWGDYGAATVDPTTGFFYTANENISGPRGTFSNWGTFITQLH